MKKYNVKVNYKMDLMTDRERYYEIPCQESYLVVEETKKAAFWAVYDHIKRKYAFEWIIFVYPKDSNLTFDGDFKGQTHAEVEITAEEVEDVFDEKAGSISSLKPLCVQRRKENFKKKRIPSLRTTSSLQRLKPRSFKSEKRRNYVYLVSSRDLYE